MTNSLRAGIVSTCLILLLLPATSSSQEMSAPKPPRERKGRLHLTVTGGDRSKPVSGADVIVRSGDGGFSEITNTNSQGAANLANVPFGLIRVQIAAQGWKTSGGQYEFKEGRSIQVNLEREQQERPRDPSPTPSAQPTTGWVRQLANTVRRPWRSRKRTPGN
jgi:Carboxypeptidase regulatory-like domain